MKKILFILPSLGTGGLERVQVTFANKLSAMGCDVTVMTFQPGDELRDELSGKVRFIYRPTSDRVGNKIPYIRHKYFDDGMWETRSSPQKLYKFFTGGEKYDVEIAFFRGTPVKAISGSTNKEAVRLAWVHSDFSVTDTYKAKFASDKAVYDAYASFDKVICVSKNAADAFIRTVGDTHNVVTVYNPLSSAEITRKAAEKPAFELPAAKLRAVLVGRLQEKTKGQLRAVRAVSRLRKEGADISLTLIGDGEDRKLIEEAVSREEAEGYILTAGSVRNPYPYIRGADLLLCSSYLEGFNLTVAEALILGTPVLSTDCAGPKEILDSGKYGMITENSEEGILNGLRSLYENPSLLDEYKEKAVLRRDLFNEDSIIQSVANFFER